MSATYSIFNGEIIESTRKANLYSVLEDLPNNTQKLIRPRDVRDAFLSSWANSTFKLTSTGTDEYIGVDSSNPNDRDVKKKILLGKRSVGSFDIMSDSLINSSDVDVFFYNTKSDTGTQSNTKIAFLAGTSSSLFTDAPYLEAVVEDGVISLNIINEQDSINIQSLNDRVTINNISFPTITENEAEDLDGKILKYEGIYPYGNLVWSDVEITSTDIGSITSETNIYGSTVSVNGYNLEFVEDRIVSETIGGIPIGSSFSEGSFTNYLGSASNWPLTEVVRELLYPYVEPILELSITNDLTGTKYAEIGVTASLSFSYSVTVFSRESSEYVGMLFLRTNGVVPEPPVSWDVLEIDSAIGTPGEIFNFTSSNPTYSETSGVLDYGLMASNIYPAPWLSPTSSVAGFSFSVIDSIEFVEPFVANTSTTDYDFTEADLLTLITDVDTVKIIEPNPGSGNDVKAVCDGESSYIYFSYPLDYGELTLIKDPNGYIIHDSTDLGLSAFTFSSGLTPSSPLDYYGEYIVYKTNNLVSYSGGGYFEFIF